MSMCIFPSTLSDPNVPEEDEEPAKSCDTSSYSESQQPPSKSSKAEGQPRAATEEDSASDSDDHH